MSRTNKEGKRTRPLRIIKANTLEGEQIEYVSKRHSWGMTEKILRRNRKLWSRLCAKKGRQLAKEAIEESIQQKE